MQQDNFTLFLLLVKLTSGWWLGNTLKHWRALGITSDWITISGIPATW